VFNWKRKIEILYFVHYIQAPCWAGVLWTFKGIVIPVNLSVNRKEVRSVRAPRETRISKEGHTNFAGRWNCPIGSATHLPAHLHILYVQARPLHGTERKKIIWEGVLIAKTKRLRLWRILHCSLNTYSLYVSRQWGRQWGSGAVGTWRKIHQMFGTKMRQLF
jgi:hypothetical protein